MGIDGGCSLDGIDMEELDRRARFDAVVLYDSCPMTLCMKPLVNLHSDIRNVILISFDSSVVPSLEMVM